MSNADILVVSIDSTAQRRDRLGAELQKALNIPQQILKDTLKAEDLFYIAQFDDAFYWLANVGTGYVRKRGYRVITLVGVLLQAKPNAIVPAVNPLMDRLIEQVDFRVSSQWYMAILQSAGVQLAFDLVLHFLCPLRQPILAFSP